MFQMQYTIPAQKSLEHSFNKALLHDHGTSPVYNKR